jgi:hypothetical protein
MEFVNFEEGSFRPTPAFTICVQISMMCISRERCAILCMFYAKDCFLLDFKITPRAHHSTQISKWRIVYILQLLQIKCWV